MAIDFDQRLTGLLPNPLSRVLFAPGGASAIGMALKLARVVTGKHKVLSLWDSFHGASIDAISVGGESVFRQNMGPMMPGVIRIPPPATYRGFLGDNEADQIKYADYLEYVIEEKMILMLLWPKPFAIQMFKYLLYNIGKGYVKFVTGMGLY